jgi:AcrR family transcriptional regulator
MPEAETLDRRGSADARRSVSRDRSNSRGDATRLRLLLMAEELMAERGIESVPLRDIGVAAGQKNNAVVQYHFGDRESLIHEIIQHRATTSEANRVELLADLLEQGQPQVEDLVRVFAVPLASHFEDGNHYLAFMSRYIIERGGYSGLEGGTGVPSATVQTIRKFLDRLLPDFPADVLEERWIMMQTNTVHTLARYQVLLKANKLTSPIDDLLEDLVRYHTAGIQTPLNS